MFLHIYLVSKDLRVETVTLDVWIIVRIDIFYPTGRWEKYNTKMSLQESYTIRRLNSFFNTKNTLK